MPGKPVYSVKSDFPSDNPIFLINNAAIRLLNIGATQKRNRRLGTAIPRFSIQRPGPGDGILVGSILLIEFGNSDYICNGMGSLPIKIQNPRSGLTVNRRLRIHQVPIQPKSSFFKPERRTQYIHKLHTADSRICRKSNTKCISLSATIQCSPLRTSYPSAVKFYDNRFPNPRKTDFDFVLILRRIL